MSAVYDLLSQLPQNVQDAINDDGYNTDSVCDAAEDYIMDLESKLSSSESEHKRTLSLLCKEHKNRKQLNEELTTRIEILEGYRPEWAKGHTDDSIAAQTMLAAMGSLWELLQVDSQTLAMQKLPKLIEEHARMLKVLTKFGKSVTAAKKGPFTLIEGRAYTHGKNTLAHDLYKILMEES